MELELRKHELRKYNAIKDCVENHGNKKRVAAQLGCTLRHVNRLISGFNKHGKQFFVHGNRGRKPSHAIDEKIKENVINLYNTTYADANFTHYCKFLKTKEKINVSYSYVRQVLMNANICSPKTRRKTRKALAKRLKEAKKEAKSKKEVKKIDKAILSLSEVHPRRPRRAYPGELIQMDASQHIWFGSKMIHLHAAIDDCTGAILGAYFDEQETLNGYYNVMHQLITNYGIPCEILTDRRTIFEYKKTKETKVENDTMTQFAYACQTLGVMLNTTSVSQAKGRVERLFGTLQSRLTVELRLANIESIEQANEFLIKNFLPEFNEEFSLPYNISKSVFIPQAEYQDINLILAVLTDRKIDKGCCIKYRNTHYKLVNEKGDYVYYQSGTEGLVIQALDGNLYFSVNDMVYALEEVPVHAETSKTFDPAPNEKKERKIYIPPMSHPWKKASFDSYVRKQKHRQKLMA